MNFSYAAYAYCYRPELTLLGAVLGVKYTQLGYEGKIAISRVSFRVAQTLLTEHAHVSTLQP